jgi:hypothetical protein
MNEANEGRMNLVECGNRVNMANRRGGPCRFPSTIDMIKWMGGLFTKHEKYFGYEDLLSGECLTSRWKEEY